MRRSDLLFHAGGECLDQFGTLVRRLSADDDNGYTHTRSGAVGSYVQGGVLLDAAANVPRVTQIGGSSLLLLEAARTNLCLQSEDLTTTWASQGTPTVGTAHTASGVSLDLLGDDSGAGAEGKTQTVSFTGDAVKAISVHWKAGTSPTPAGDEIVVYDVTAAATRLLMRVSDAGDGSPSVLESIGTYLGYEVLTDGVYRLLFQTAAVTAANTNSLRLYAGRTGTVADTGNVYWGGIQAENAPEPSSYVATTSGTVARNADTFYAGWPHAPRAMTGYAKFREMSALSSGAWASATGILSISNSGWSGSRIHIYRPTGSGDVYAAQFYNGATAVAVTVDVAPGWGDEIELCMTLTSAGVIQLSGSNEGATTVTGTASSANGLPSSWSDSRLYVGSLGASSQGLAAFRSIKFARGVRTMAEMRAI